MGAAQPSAGEQSAASMGISNEERLRRQRAKIQARQFEFENQREATPEDLAGLAKLRNAPAEILRQKEQIDQKRAISAAADAQAPDETDAYIKALNRAATDRKIRRSQGAASAFKPSNYR